MSFSLSARKLVVCWCSMVAIPVVVLSQNSFVPNGGEYSICGKLPGDQAYPQVSFTTNGGYLVWQDNWVDGNGFGVGAMRLKSDLSGSGVPFRIDSLVAGDQEAAQVSMLNNGGAAFAWQGGRQGFQHIYSRFLSPSNNWVTGDVLVSAATNRFQVTPVMATLLNGNVAVAYVSVNQAGPGSLMDVYLQMLTPAGNKIGGEVLVNQFTDNNQRTPAIAALANGTFVVGWISEQERWTDASNGVPSVDFYARIFDSTGAPKGSEFLVNISSNICAAPDLAAAADGGFIGTWMEKDLVVRNNGWDIFARRFSSAGVGGNQTRVNTQLYGDQYAPKIRRAGSTYLDIWTSLGQDGSREGVFGRYLNDDASVSGAEFQVNSSTFGPQKDQALGSDSTGRFLAAWTSFGAVASGFDLYGQIFANPALAVTGTNDSVFDTDPNANPNSVSNSVPTAPVILPPGNPGGTPGPTSITQTFADVKGTYNGLVNDLNGVSSTDSGYITITVSAKGAQGGFTAKLEMGGRKYSFSGPFDASGAYSGTVSGMTVNLQVDLHGGNQITGQISNGNWTASLQAYRAVFSKLHPTSLNGTYTMVIQSTDGTMGNGFGTLTVDTSGDVKWNLTLPDGTKLNASTTLSGAGMWPLYAQPYKGEGVTIGWMQFGSTADDGFDGQCVWTKPAGASGVYSGGLTNGVNVFGSHYKAPPYLFRSFGGSKVILDGGGLSSPITNTVTWGPNNKVVPAAGPKAMRLNISTSTGLFQGTIGTGKGAVPFQGVLFEKNNVGLGFFLGADQSGTVSFAPNH